MSASAAHNFSYAVIDALSANIAILDSDGIVLVANKAWERFCASNGDSWLGSAPGTNYLQVCEASTREANEDADSIIKAIREVLDQGVEEVHLEQATRPPMEEHWFFMRITRLQQDATVFVVISNE